MQMQCVCFDVCVCECQYVRKQLCRCSLQCVIVVVVVVGGQQQQQREQE